VRISEYLGLLSKIKDNIITYKNVLRLEPTEPGFALQIRKSKQLVFEECFGAKDQRTKQKITTDTKFLMASLAKPVVANFILSNLDYFPEKYVNKYIYTPFDELTICDLMKHRSGLPDYLSFLNKTKINYMSLSELVKATFMQELKFEHGQKIEYSNSGYVVLTQIIEKVFKANYEDILQDKYSQLGINFSFKYQKEFASNYKNKGGVYKKVIHDRYTTGWGDGLLYSSVSEYPKIFEGELKYKQLLHKAHSTYGEFYYHLGGVPGVDSMFTYVPEMELEIILICNSTHNTIILSDLILDSIEGKKQKQLLSI